MTDRFSAHTPSEGRLALSLRKSLEADRLILKSDQERVIAERLSEHKEFAS